MRFCVLGRSQGARSPYSAGQWPSRAVDGGAWGDIAVGDGEVTRIVTSSDPRLLQVLRGVVRYRAREAGFAESDAEALAMAIDEAASNVIRHTYGNRHDARLALEIWTYPDRMELVLEDSGPKVEPGEVHPRPLEDLRPGGLGTFFIKSFVDECSYEENFPAGNRLKMVKRISRKVFPEQ